MSPARTIDVSQFIDNEKLSRTQWLVISLCGLTAMLDGFDVQAIAFVVPVIAREWGVEPSGFGLVFATGLLGLCIGSSILGPMGDRYGRRNVILAATVFFGIASLITATASSLPQLMLWRFVTGVGLGAVLPNLFALTSEYSPTKLRATLTTLMFCGFPAGAVIGGAISASVIPTLGWKIVFIAGGILPLLVAIILFISLPESIAFLIHQKSRTREILAVVRRLRPDFEASPDDIFVMPQERPGVAKVSALFRDRLRPVTLLLWVLFFFNLLSIYFLANWLPVVLQKAGLPLTTSILGAVILNLGGIVGALTLARIVDRSRNVSVVLLGGYVGAVICVAGLGYPGLSMYSALGLTFAAGFLVFGCNFVIAAWASVVYPAALRATGVGSSMGIGRLGSIIGPLAGAALLASDWSTQHILMFAALPCLMCAGAVTVFKIWQARRASMPQLAASNSL